MHTIFIGLGNSRMADPHWLVLNIADKIKLKRSIFIAPLLHYQILVFTINGKIKIN